MAFNLRVVFTGLCALVRNADATKRCQMCVVLPDGRGRQLIKEKVSADGRPLKRHRGFLQFKVHQLAALADENGPLPTDADAIWYLDRHRLTFYTIPADRARPPQPFRDKGYNRIADLDRIVPQHAQLDPKTLDEYPPDTVLAQVLLAEGDLSHNDRTHRWVFPPTLDGRVLNPNLSHEAILEIDTGLEQVDVVASPFDGGEPVRWSFIGRDRATVEITIANLCDDNPLRWETERARTVDDDFRWYYRLLSEDTQDDLRNELRGLPFPVPEPVPDALESRNGQAINCIPAQSARSDFNLDRFLPSALTVQPALGATVESFSGGRRRAK